MRAFIIRPFGTKNGVDFDRVEAQLISPALEARGITGRTTGEIARQGNIREDMFQLLVTADIVIADISIHNANVFYELGLRHALQDKHTLLLRCRGDDVPFDIKTDRYLVYDQEDPGASLDALTRVLRETVNEGRTDSPMFQLLPNLQPQARARFVVVPREFREAVKRALVARDLGDLDLFAQELATFGFEWAREGLRAVAEAQRALEAWEDACRTWNAIRAEDPDDVQANLRLGNLYQKLGRVAESDQALDRVEARGSLASEERSELRSLRGSNEKTHWINEWKDSPPEERRPIALESAHLERALEAYERGFREDLNAFYPGWNALALISVRSELGRALPETWNGLFESDAEAELERTALDRRREQLAAVVEAAVQRARALGDPWVAICEADLGCLTSSRPSRVQALYRRALAEPTRQVLEACHRQLEIFAMLGIAQANTPAALEIVDEHLAKLRDEVTAQRVLVFTGHRIDAPDRASPRFPNREQSVAAAREMIREAVEEQIRDVGAKRTLGYSGAASGGDILFHEVCEELGVATRLYLAGPRDDYVQASVQDAGPDWVQRFDRLVEKFGTHLLSESLELPRWLQSVEDYDVWQRSNLWKLHHAMAHGANRVALIALWDGETGDSAGGTQHMVEIAERCGAATKILDAKRLLAV